MSAEKEDKNGVVDEIKKNEENITQETIITEDIEPYKPELNKKIESKQEEKNLSLKSSKIKEGETVKFDN